MSRVQNLPGYRLETRLRCEIGPRKPKAVVLERPRRTLWSLISWLGIVTALACGLAAVCVWDAFTGGPK